MVKSLDDSIGVHKLIFLGRPEDEQERDTRCRDVVYSQIPGTETARYKHLGMMHMVSQNFISQDHILG